MTRDGLDLLKPFLPWRTAFGTAQVTPAAVLQLAPRPRCRHSPYCFDLVADHP